MTTSTAPSNEGDTAALGRARQLADRLDCLLEDDLLLLTGATPGTVETWRKRGEGPSYALIGNKYLYPRKAVAEWLQSRVRVRTKTPAKELL